MKALPLFLITLPGFLLLWLGADEREVVNGEKLQLKPTTLALPIQSPVLRSKKAVRKVESNLSDAFRSPPPQPIPDHTSQEESPLGTHIGYPVTQVSFKYGGIPRLSPC